MKFSKNYLIIINPNQFGYNNSTYYYAKYLKSDCYDVIYICWDKNFTKIFMPNVRVVYVDRKGNFLTRSFRFLHYALKELEIQPAIVFIKYFKVISIALRLLRPSYCFVLDIRTGSVHTNSLFRKIYDTRLRLECFFFKHVTVISESLAGKLGISHKAHILPLGADIISKKNKSFDDLNLLYVGTLYNRNIENTILGFKKFYDELKGQIPLSYIIIGSGPGNEEADLKNLITQLGLTEVVRIAGRIPHDQLTPHFDISNVGISYVPLTDYYDVQPVTKTFEYLLSGMPVIATNTSENRKVISQDNGVLIGETPEDFYSGLKEVFDRRQLFDSGTIRNTSMDYTWENIVQNNLKNYLEKIRLS